MRMARAALGISQLELAELLGVSKITLARVETLETPMKADIFMRAIKLFRDHGFLAGNTKTLEIKRFGNVSGTRQSDVER